MAEFSRVMKQKTFETLKEYIETNIGIKIPQAKKVMVESRLIKRLRHHGFSTYEQYLEYFLSEGGQRDEKARFIDAITTNKTDFFRENDHFTLLTNTCLPDIVQSEKEILLWSAASSIGQEAYTLAMVVEEFLQNHRGVKYKILATDISEEVLEKGRLAIYPLKDGDTIPHPLKKKYCMVSRDPAKPTIRIKKLLRDRVLFKHINLTSESYLVKKKYHIIFLRNVMIYFNKGTQEEILRNLNNHLASGGYLFLGHSENLTGISLPLKRVGPSVYKKEM